MHRVLELISERVRTGSVPGRRTDPHRIVLSIEGGGMRGTASVPPVSRLTTDPRLLAAGLESGRQAARDIFAR